MAPEKLDWICQKVAGCYKRVFGEKLHSVFLYGSYARGDYTGESDIDFAAVVDEDRLPMQEKLKQLWDETADLDPEYEALISPTAIPLAEFEKYKERLPYYRNIRKEGRQIG
ncbi:MAG: nucleotidyltransferase domain-containing protein [Schwartzia sp.]|nr:nucleotidyltransferase domain-containing protein [Schwartzia sp. (in: firmicutes)]